MKAPQTTALSMLLSLSSISTSTEARDWPWYPRKPPADAGALRPELEGTRGDDMDPGGLSELEEMRRWLRRRDEDRRQQGITIPDTVEPFDPAEELNLQRRHWPGREESTFGHSSGGSAIGESGERIRDTLYPRSYDETRQPTVSRRHWHRRHAGASRRHRSSTSGHKKRR